jgi:hypothetical protein
LGAVRHSTLPPRALQPWQATSEADLDQKVVDAKRAKNVADGIEELRGVKGVVKDVQVLLMLHQGEVGLEWIPANSDAV